MELRKSSREGVLRAEVREEKNRWKMAEKILLEIYVSKERKSEWMNLSKEEWMKCKRQRKKNQQ